jgi:hypothetical protein
MFGKFDNLEDDASSFDGTFSSSLNEEGGYGNTSFTNNLPSARDVFGSSRNDDDVPF